MNVLVQLKITMQAAEQLRALMKSLVAEHERDAAKRLKELDLASKRAELKSDLAELKRVEQARQSLDERAKRLTIPGLVRIAIDLGLKELKGHRTEQVLELISEGTIVRGRPAKSA